MAVHTRSFSRRFLLSAILAAGALPSTARAEPSPAERAIAERLFDQAKEQLRDNRVSAACASFAESQRLDPSTGTLLNLAACHEQEGKLASAWVELREAMSRVRRENRPERLRFAADRLAAIEPRLAYLTLVVPEGPRGPASTIRLDGRDLGPAAWGVPIPVDEGPHEATVQAAGVNVWRATVQVRNGEQKTIAFPAHVGAKGISVRDQGPPAPDDGANRSAAAGLATPALATPALAAPALAAPAPPLPLVAAPAEGVAGTGLSEAHGRKTIAVVAGGLGLAALVVGTYAGVHAATLWRERNQACRNDACSREGLDLGDRASTSATVATWSLAGGGALLATGALLWFWPAKASEELGRPLARSHFSATPLPKGASLQMGGVF